MKTNAFRRVATLAIIVGTLVTWSGSGVARQAPTPDQDALRVFRTIISAEMNRPFGRFGFGSLQDLVSQNTLGTLATQLTLLDPSSAAYSNYRIRLTRSADAKAFQISMEQQTECGLALFSSEGGVIFTGRAIGCK